MPNLNLTHNGNMSITDAYFYEGRLYVRYEPNTTGRVTRWDWSPNENELVSGQTYTFTIYPSMSGVVLTENFTVSGYDQAGVLRSDTSVLRQDYDKDYRKFLAVYQGDYVLSQSGFVINSSSVTENNIEINATVTGTTGDTAQISMVTKNGAPALIKSWEITEPEPLYPGLIRVDYRIDEAGGYTLAVSGNSIFDYVVDPNNAIIHPDSSTFNYTFDGPGLYTFYYATTNMVTPRFDGTPVVYAYIPDGFSLQTSNFQNTPIGSVRLPGDLTQIPDTCFKHCGSLTAIGIPDSVTRIGDAAFWNCGVLANVVLPRNLTTLGISAFYGCARLQSIIIPSGVTVLNSTTFQYCPSLSSVILPDTLTSIGVQVFGDCYNLTSITITENVESIGQGAFANCLGLTEMVFLSETPPSLGDDALGSTSYTFPFYVPCQSVGEYRTAVAGKGYDPMRVKCNNLATAITLNVNDTITNYGIATTTVEPYDAVVSLQYSTSNSNIATIDINTGRIEVVSEGYVTISVLDVYTGLYDSKEIYVVKTADPLWVYYDVARTGQTVSILNSTYGVQFYNPRPFVSGQTMDGVDVPLRTGTFRFTSVTPGGTPIGYTISDSAATLVWYDDPTNVKVEANALGTRAFAGLTTVLKVEIPGNINIIGERVFSGCTSLNSAVLEEGVTKMYAGAFRDCTSLRDVVLPDSLSGPATWLFAFQGCTSLTGVTFPSYLEEIPDGAFNGCTALKTVTFPNSLIRIYQRAFAGCTALKEIDLGDSLTNLDGGAFDGCTSLTGVTFPASTEDIGNLAFNGCTGLTEMVFLGTTPPHIVTNTSLGSASATFPFYVPCESVAAYRTAVSEAGYDPARVICVSPGPDTGDTGTTVITSLTLSVAEEIVENGVAIPIYSPSDVETSFVFTSSNPELATIDSGGNITVLGNGIVTFCVEDEISGLQDCKAVAVRKAVYIDWIEIVVADEIETSGVTSAIYSPSNADVSLVYSSSDPNIATVDPYTGEITVIETGEVTLCVRDVYTNKTDCKTINAKAKPKVCVTYNITTSGYSEIVKTYAVELQNRCIKIEYNGESIDFSTLQQGWIPNTGTYHASYNFPEPGLYTLCFTFTNNEIPERAFSGNTTVVAATIEEGYKVAGKYAFRGTKITDIVIPSSMCEGNPDGLRRDYSFGDCTELTSVTFCGHTEGEVTENLAYCGNAFCGTTNVERVVIGDKLRLDSITLGFWGRTLRYASLGNGYSGVPARYFRNFGNLQEVVLPDNPTGGLGERCFEGCTSLQFTIPSTITQIGEAAFYKCSSIESLTIPSGVSIILASTFAYCSSLTGVTFEGKVRLAGDYIFSNCTSLVEVKFMSSETADGQWGDEIFRNDNNLQRIYSYATTPPAIDTSTFEGIGRNGVLYYPSGSNYNSWLVSGTTYPLSYYGWTGSPTL